MAMSLFGKPNVRKLSDRRDLKGLFKALQYRKDPDVQEAAAHALGQLGDAQAVEPLISAFRHRYYRVREAAAQALGSIGDVRAVERLISALGDEDGYVRNLAGRALEAIGSQAVEPLIFALGDKDDHVREKAAQALGSIRDLRAVEPLLSVLGDRIELVRLAAAWALGEIGDPRAVEPLITVSKDEDFKVAHSALRALERVLNNVTAGQASLVIGPDSINMLIQALPDGAAVHALQMVGEPAFETVCRALANESAAIRCGAAHVAGTMGRGEAINLLLPLMMIDPDVSVRSAASRSLTQLGWEPPDALMRSYQRFAERADAITRGWGRLYENFEKEDVEVLINAMRTIPDGEVRNEVANSLWGKTCLGEGKHLTSNDRAQAHRHIASLMSLAREQNGLVRNTAIELLGIIGDPRGVSAIVDALKRFEPGTDENWGTFEKGFEALVKIGDAAVDRLLELLEHDDYRIRAEAARTLGEIGQPRAVPALIRHLNDVCVTTMRHSVNEQAAIAIVKIGGNSAVEVFVEVLRRTSFDFTMSRYASEYLLNAGAAALDPLRQLLDLETEESRRREIQKIIDGILSKGEE